MNPIGINLWNWTGNFNASGIKYIEKAASIGYTAIEIGLENTEFDLGLVSKAIEDNNLAVTICIAALGKSRRYIEF